jgi:hypothetical protein
VVRRFHVLGLRNVRDARLDALEPARKQGDFGRLELCEDFPP